jgi:glycosyltransferase involved in cell wall biosynthesis
MPYEGEESELKLLFISAAFPPMRAGESEHAYHECRHLASAGIEVHLLTSRSNKAPLDVPFRVHPVMPGWSWRHLPILTSFLKRLRPDAVLLMYSGWIYGAHPMITFVPTIVGRLFPGIPFVTQMEIEEGENWTTVLDRATRKVAQHLVGGDGVDYHFGTLLRDSTKLVFLSERHRRTHSERFEAVPGKSVVIPPPPLLPMCTDSPDQARVRGRASLALQENDFLLTFFGYADKNKGIETLFRAVQLLSKDRPRVRLAMIGGGRGSTTQTGDDRARQISRYESEVLALPDQLGIADRVTWLNGYDSDSDAASLYLYSSDACVLPFDQGVTMSRSSFAAAVAHGIPVITTRGATLETPFRHEDNLLLCPPRDPESLAHAVRRVMDERELDATLRKGAHRLASEWFSWAGAVRRLSEVIAQAPSGLAFTKAS